MSITASYFKSKVFSTALLPELTLLAVFCVLQLKHINADFWNDEIYTLKHYVFTSLYQTITEYVPNNHVLFSLINNAYLKLITVDSLFALMDTPYKLRVIPFIYSLLLFFFTYKTAKQFFDRTTALLALAILCTTIPYYNFALQIRGYGLSALFLVMILYYCSVYLKSPKHLYLYVVAILTTGLLYTIPSNLYTIFSVLAFLGIYSLISIWDRTDQKLVISKLFSSPPFRLMISLVAGILVSLGLYSWIFTEVFMNDWVISGPSFQFSKLEYYIPAIVEGVTSNRWILVILLAIGYVFNYRKLGNPWVVLMFMVCVVPILLVYIHGDNAPLRIFIVQMPLYALLMSVGLTAFWRLIPKSGKYDLVFVAAVFLYSIFIFNNETKAIDNKLLHDLKDGRRTQDIYYQYYASHYQPLKEFTNFKDHNYNKNYPVVMVGCDGHGIPNYLAKFDINYYTSESFLSLISKHDSIYIVTNHPNQFMNIPEYKVDFSKNDLSYHNILLLHKDPDTSTNFKELYFNDFDSLQSRIDTTRQYDSLYSFSGTYSEKLDGSNIFSTSFNAPFDLLDNRSRLKVTLISRFEEDCKALLVFDISRNGKNNIWHGAQISSFFHKQGTWNKSRIFFTINVKPDPKDTISIYIWNLAKDNIWIDDLKIEVEFESTRTEH